MGKFNITPEQIAQNREQIIALIPEGYSVHLDKDWLWVVPPEVITSTDLKLMTDLGFCLSHRGRETEVGLAYLYNKCLYAPKVATPAPVTQTQQEPSEAELANMI